MIRFAILLAWAAGLAILPARADGPVQQAQAAGAKPGLFVNLTSDEVWRGWMALHFAWRTQQQGHPTAVFLNLEAVRWAWAKLPPRSVDGAQTPPQEALRNLLRDGGTVLICGPCIQRLGIPEAELLPGVRMGAPGVTQALMFAEGTRIISW